MAKRRLDLAIAKTQPALNFEFERRPFCLRPERKGFLPWREILADLGVSRGDPNWSQSFIPQMEARGKLVQINFDFDVELGNSLGSLRLLWWVKVEYGFEKQEELAGILARRHFEEKSCVSRKETLLQACADLGLATDEAEGVLSSNKFMTGSSCQLIQHYC